MDSAIPEGEKTKSVISTLGCEHYKRRCEILSPCCKKFFTCRFCHDEHTQSPPPPGEKKDCQVLYLDRKAISTIRCKICKLEQTPSETCKACNIRFANYFCKICRLYDDGESVYHCEECGVCRVGSRESTIHCSECKSCFYKQEKTHKCYPNALDDNCPICLQHFAYARESFTQLRCSHWLHISCLRKYVSENNGINCPVCIKPIFEESEEMKKIFQEAIESSLGSLPPELRDLKVTIFCNSCQKTSADVQFNFIAFKCSHCGSYNTKR